MVGWVNDGVGVMLVSGCGVGGGGVDGGMGA